MGPRANETPCQERRRPVPRDTRTGRRCGRGSTSAGYVSPRWTSRSQGNASLRRKRVFGAEHRTRHMAASGPTTWSESARRNAEATTDHCASGTLQRCCWICWISERAPAAQTTRGCRIPTKLGRPSRRSSIVACSRSRLSAVGDNREAGGFTGGDSETPPGREKRWSASK